MVGVTGEFTLLDPVESQLLGARITGTFHAFTGRRCEAVASNDRRLDGSQPPTTIWLVENIS